LAKVVGYISTSKVNLTEDTSFDCKKNPGGDIKYKCVFSKKTYSSYFNSQNEQFVQIDYNNQNYDSETIQCR